MAKLKNLPPYIEHPIAAAIRGLMSLPLMMGLDRSLEMARSLGHLYPKVSPRRFERAVEHLAEAFPEWSDEERRACALKSYQHLFQLGVEVLYAPRLITPGGFSRHLAFTNLSPAVNELLKQGPCMLISGHCGNWELIGYAISMLGFPLHAVYRPLDLRPLDAWLYNTRARRGLTLVSKFGVVRSIPPVIRRGEPVGLVADQSGGDRGVFVPFFGRLTSSYKTIGLFALETKARVVCGIARRMKPGESVAEGPATETRQGGRQFSPGPGEPASMRYTIELVDDFGPEDWQSHPDPLFYVTARYRRAIEMMVRRSPEQYLWMHRIWRARPAHERHNKPFPPSLRDKLAALPWMTPEELERVVNRSELDKADILKTAKT